MSLDLRLRRIFSEVLAIQANQITDESSPQNVEMWDSMNAMSLALALEEEFDVQFSDSELTSMLTYRIIRETLGAKGIE